jgi:hypothetical protein
MDISVTVCIGQYSLDVGMDDTDALALPDALHHMAEHIDAMLKKPTVRKAMGTPLKVDDLD